MKKQTYKELERELKSNEGFAIFITIMFLIMALGLFLFMTKSSFLKQENQELREQIPTWTLEVECYELEDIDYVYFKQNYTNYIEYKEAIDVIFDIKEYKQNCEVIK